MSYTTGIPTSGQSLGNSRPQIQGNFDYINTAFAINHVAFNASGVGKHKFLQMPEQVSAPATAANEGGLYTKEAQSITNLFWRQESSGTEIQLTNIAPSSAANGYTFLPGALLLQWGTLSASSTSQRSVSFPIAFSANPYSINFVPYRADSSNPGSTYVFYIDNSSIGTGGFTLYNRSTHTYGFYWIAIGPKA